MKIAVVDQSGPFSTALTAWPIQLSPAAIDVPLCCEVGPLAPPDGSSTEKLGSAPFWASVMNRSVGTRLVFCDV